MTGEIDTFQNEASEVMTEIRSLFASLIEQGCGRVNSAQDVSEGFGIHRKLGWQIWKVAYGEEPFLAATFMPRPRAIRTWLDAAARREVPKDLLQRIEGISDSFERLIEAHAGDRDVMDMMLESCSSPTDEKADLRWRKQAFTGNSYVLGVHARVLLAAAFLHPSAGREGYFDIARIHGLIGLVRTRPDLRWPIAQTVMITADNEELAPKRECLLDGSPIEATRVPLLPEFCSDPLPTVQRRTGLSGLLTDELLPGPMGQTGESTILTGEVWRAPAPHYQTHEGETALFGTGVRTPAELLICDLFVHRDVFGDVSKQPKVFTELTNQATRDERDLLVVPEGIQYLGEGLSRVHAPEVVGYHEMAGFVFDRLDWKAEEFNLHRVRMHYPPMPISVMLELDMPIAPDGFVS